MTEPALRAVVLDLDDTLFDTSGTLLVPANREAAAAMIGRGLPGTIESVAQRRMALGRAHPEDDADALTVRSFGLDDPGGVVASAGRDAYFNRTVRRIEPFVETVPLLTGLQGRFDLFLMTVGAPRTQQRKVELLGIEDFFDEVVLVDVDGESKVDALRDLLARRGLDPVEVVVVGDRIDREIEAGRRLGTWTVRMDHGEGRHLRPSGPAQQAHYTIDRLDGLPYVIADIEDSDEPPEPVASDEAID